MSQFTSHRPPQGCSDRGSKFLQAGPMPDPLEDPREPMKKQKTTYVDLCRLVVSAGVWKQWEQSPSCPAKIEQLGNMQRPPPTLLIVSIDFLLANKTCPGTRGSTLKEGSGLACLRPGVDSAVTNLGGDQTGSFANVVPLRVSTETCNATTNSADARSSRGTHGKSSTATEDSPDWDRQAESEQRERQTSKGSCSAAHS